MASSYPYPSEVNVEEFVTVKLSKTNYFMWKTPMFRLIKKHGLEDFINRRISRPPKKINVPSDYGCNFIKEKNPEHQHWKRSDELLRKWILDTLSTDDDDIHTIVKPLRTAKQMWAMLEKQNKELGEDQSRYLPLIKAILDGDSEKTHNFLDQHRNAIRAPITNFASTPLLVAAESGRRNDLVRELVDRMSPDDLAHADRSGGTALHLAARGGNTKVAMLLVGKNPQLPYVLNGIALFVVKRYPKLARGHPSPLTEMAKMPSAFPSGARLNSWQHLIYSCVPMYEENVENYFTNREYIVSANSFNPDVPTRVENVENYSTDRGDIESANSFLLDVPTRVENVENYSTDRGDIGAANGFVLVPQIKNMRKRKLIHHQSQQLTQFLCLEIVKLDFPKNFSKIGEPLRIAAADGVHELVEEIFYSFPTAIYSRHYTGLTVFHHAIINRRENVFNLLYQIGEHYNILLSEVDKSGNNCLHLAGCLGSQHNFNLRASAAGAALQMQRELQWFKEVEKFVSIQDKDKKNKDKETPAMVFTKTHLKLVEEGEKWMKDRASSCIIVAALVVTIMFAAAITVPGGNNSNTGLPFFATKKVFIIFAASDALALFSSTSSVLMFLSILTSRYAEDDFLYVLPNRLIIGLVTLFFSILFMMIAFTTTLEIRFGDKNSWILIAVATLACVPATLFVSLQFPLLAVMIKSTYCPGIFGKQHDRLFS